MPRDASRLLALVPRHITIQEEKHMLPDTRLHVLDSIQRLPGESFYRLEYNMTTWGGWLGFWDHVSAIRGDTVLAEAASGLKPFVGARELLAPGTMHARNRLKKVLCNMLSKSGLDLEAEGACIRGARRQLQHPDGEHEGKEFGAQTHIDSVVMSSTNVLQTTAANLGD